MYDKIHADQLQLPSGEAALTALRIDCTQPFLALHIADIISGLLERDVERRWSALRMLEHPALQHVACDFDGEAKS
eukprot:3805574-Ditylum_brightwellii.AAC.1